MKLLLALAALPAAARAISEACTAKLAELDLDAAGECITVHAANMDCPSP